VLRARRSASTASTSIVFWTSRAPGEATTQEYSRREPLRRAHARYVSDVPIQPQEITSESAALPASREVRIKLDIVALWHGKKQPAGFDARHDCCWVQARCSGMRERRRKEFYRYGLAHASKPYRHFYRESAER
jgi:hypothetical protein